jgi:hypothetical protein
MKSFPLTNEEYREMVKRRASVRRLASRERKLTRCLRFNPTKFRHDEKIQLELRRVVKFSAKLGVALHPALESEIVGHVMLT